MELNIVDKNDAEQTTTHESVLESQPPIKLVLGRGATSVTKTATVKLTNADRADATPDSILLSVDTAAGDCPAGLVSVTGTNPVSVAAGATAVTKLTLSAGRDDFRSPNRMSPGRCTAVLQASIAGNTEPDASNNRVDVVVDVNDGNDS